MELNEICFLMKSPKSFEQQNQFMTVTIGLVTAERGLVIEGSTTTNVSTGATDTSVIDEIVMVIVILESIFHDNNSN